jgi:hypothetical protein
MRPVAGIRRHLRRRVEPTVGHYALLGLLIGLVGASTIVIGALALNEFQHQREARVMDQLAFTATKSDVAKLKRDLQAYARAQAPTDREIADAVVYRLKVCLRTPVCHGQVVRLINRVVRITNNRIVPAPANGTPAAPGPAPARTIIVQGKPGKPGRDGAPGTPGRAGKPGGAGTVDSNIVDGLDNRIADLEGALQSVVGRVAVLDRLVGALCRLLTPGKCA